MLSVLVVDDDVVVRTNLKTLFDWEKYGFSISEEASNGHDAVQKLQKCDYNIVITDMNMPIMDGVALIGYIEHNHPSIKVIALSGYDDFDYVRQSMKKGAVDYILKHKLDKETLLGVLDTARESIITEQKDEEINIKLQEQLYQGRKVLIQKFISKLIKGHANEEKQIEYTIQSLNICMKLKNLAVIVAEVDDYSLLKEQNPEVIIQSFLNLSEEIIKDSGKALISHMGNGNFVIIFSFGNINSNLYTYNTLTEVIGRIRSSIKRYLGITCSFGVSGICDDVSNIAKAYSEAERALKEKFYTGKDCILWSGNDKKTREVFLSLDIKDEDVIVENLKMANRKKTEDYLETIFGRAIKLNASYKSVQMICAELVTITIKVAKEFGVEDTFLNENTDTLYEILKKYDTIQDIKQFIISTFNKLILLIEASEMNNSYSNYTKKAIEFIYKNYHKTISLADAAEYVGVSNQYLSTVFKEDCNLGFIDYLNHMRVERSKTLITSSGSKLKEIIGMVGFNNYNYFFKVFKEITGMTPAEYEKICHR
jgi:two-component system, response regulator YesN